MRVTGAKNNREQLLQEGFCIIPKVLSAEKLEVLRRETDILIDSLSGEEKKKSGGQGSILELPYLPMVFADLIAWKPALTALHDLGFSAIRYWSGYIIAREPHTKAAYWHHDWPWWNEPESADPLPHQLFLMYYLINTTPENGCLRVIPESHRRRFPQHELGGHNTDAKYQDPETSPAYADAEDGVDVPITAGDLLIGDARILHAPRANTTGVRRTVITMWFLPRWDELSETLQAGFHQRLRVPLPEGLQKKAVDKIEPMLVNYSGHAEPAVWNRVPGEYLK